MAPAFELNGRTIMSKAVWFPVAVAFCLLSLSAQSAMATKTSLGAAGLSVGYYDGKCGNNNVEDIIYQSLQKSFAVDVGVAPGIVRIAFHDCFVRGCDASLLLDGNTTEKASPVNSLLRPAAFDAIDAAKSALEAVCPGVVSCADIIQYTSRDSVLLTGGQGWNVRGGRRDGLISLIGEPILNIPSPNFTVPLLLPTFQAKGLNATQMVALSGSHTIGRAHCQFIFPRIWTYPSSTGADPVIPPDFLDSLRRKCPSVNSTGPVNLDVQTNATFDSDYFQNIINKRGLLNSDQSLLDDGRTSGAIYQNNNANFFNTAFGDAMIAMAAVEVLTGPDVGQIRQNCRRVNSY